MYYNRVLSPEFAKLLENGRELRWLFDFVKNNNKLDFQIGRNKTKQWISVYFGLTRLFSIRKFKNSVIFIDADATYKDLLKELYGRKSITENFQKEIESLIVEIENLSQFDRYFKKEKEGYFQNHFSRRYGINSDPDDQFVIIDKEAVIGYKDQDEKKYILGNIQKPFKELQREISILYPKRYGSELEKKSIGNELDFLALDNEGNILLIEFKDGSSTSGIYRSPLQIGVYFEIFSKFPIKELEFTILEMLAQKQKIGLINPQWNSPNTIKALIPVLIISEYNDKSSAKGKFNEILNLIRKRLGNEFLNNLQTYNYTLNNGLSKW